MKEQLPADFVKRVSQDAFLGEGLLEALEQNAPVSVRYNPMKLELPEDLKQVSWCPTAGYLPERPIFTLDPLFHAGCYYPQEAGSMMLDQVLRQLDLPDEPIVLDLCAAPGGKSTLIASFLNNKGLLLSNEIVRSRAHILHENTSKWAFGNTVVSNNDPADFEILPGLFDLILTDVPCSGEGMFRKDHAARNEWSEQHVQACAKRQEELLNQVWEALKPGGYLVYSTCTFNETENELQVQRLMDELDAEVLPLNFHPFKKDRQQLGAYCLPSENDGEGFYIAVLRKPTYDVSYRLPKLKNPKVKAFSDLTLLDAYVQPSDQLFYEREGTIHAIPEKHRDTALMLLQQLRIMKWGTEIGTIMKGQLNPSQELAWSKTLLAPGKQLEVNREQALKYLKGETFNLEAEKGWYVLCFEGQALGWIKHLGNRFNNLYPTHYRIRMKI